MEQQEGVKATVSIVACLIWAEEGPEGGRRSALEVRGPFSARAAIEIAIDVAKEHQAFVDFSIDGIEQQVCWANTVETSLALHELRVEHRRQTDLAFVRNQSVLFNAIDPDALKDVPATVVRPRTKEECPIDEIGPVYLIRLHDGTVQTAYAFELTKVPNSRVAAGVCTASSNRLQGGPMGVVRQRAS